MNHKFSVGCLFASSILLSGCNFNSDELSSNMLRIEQKQNKLDNAVTNLVAQINRNELTDFQQLSKNVATSSRFASVVSNYMRSEKVDSLQKADIGYLLSISDTFKNDLYRDVLYKSLREQGRILDSKSITFIGQPGYLNEGTWIMVYKPGSMFSKGFPDHSIKALPYESISKPRCKVNSTAIAFHALIFRNGPIVDPNRKYEIIDSGDSWDIQFSPKLSTDEVKNYRVVVQARCRANQEPVGNLTPDKKDLKD